MKSVRTGSKVRYISDVHGTIPGKICTAVDFDLEHRVMSLECSDGQIIAAFWDEVEVVEY